MRWIGAFLLVIAVGVGVAWLVAGRAAGPALEIRQPATIVGQSSPLDVAVSAPGARLSKLDVVLQQGGRSWTLYTLGASGQAELRREGGDRLVISRRVGKKDVPDLQPGPARIVVRAARPVLYGLRQSTSETTRDVQMRFEPPRVEILSTFHYINQGGAEFVVYRANPGDVESFVRVGDQSYRGFPGASVGIKDPTVHVAFFALLFDQNPRVPIDVVARDAAGNEAAAALDHRVFPKPFSRSRIELDDRFLQRVVAAIGAATPAMNLSTAPPDLLPSFLKINGDLRQRNARTLVEWSGKTAKQMLWTEAFQPLSNAKVEARFADSRTYVYQGKDVDHQTHLGFDLAVTQHIPVIAANRGVVLYAGDLGIYGNCVVIDHGLGVQSLYGHLSSIDVKAGETVDKGKVMGRSGMTGLAAGDHLHFTILVDGRPVNPVEWWDPKWMTDRVFRKVREAGGSL